jgi:hypothetical protein
MATFLARSLGPDARLTDIGILRVRYAPGRKLVVHYGVGLDGRRHDAVAMIASDSYLAGRAVKPESVALARRIAGRSPARMPLRYEPELDALVHWYPLDLELPALAERPKRLVEELEAAGVELGDVGEPVRLAYTPRRRAVLRIGESVLKVYDNQPDFAGAAANLVTAGASRGIRTAAFLGCLPERQITVQSLLRGVPPARPTAVALAAGELLHVLADHGTPDARLAVARPHQQLAVAAASATFIAAIQPALGGRLTALLRELESIAPSIDRVVPSHGDFSAHQLVVTPEGLAVVDWDAMCLAPAALDPATYAAHLVYGGQDDLDVATDALHELLEGYHSRPLGLWWYLATAILRRARAPFKYFDERWPERIAGMVAAAETALAR